MKQSEILRRAGWTLIIISVTVMLYIIIYRTDWIILGPPK